MTNHTFIVTIGAPDDLATEEVCRLLNRIINNGLDVARTTDPEDTDDPDINLIEEMLFEDAKPGPE
jgi:hypothetical protein